MIRPDSDQVMEAKPGSLEEPKLEETLSGSDNGSGKLIPASGHEEPQPSLDTSKEVAPLDNDEIDLPTWAKRTVSTLDPATLEARQRGILLEDLYVYGSDSTLRVQHTVLSALWRPLAKIATLCRRRKSGQGPQAILHGFDGLLQNGEMLLVLGRPGSGCSTFLKAVCGRLDGLDLDPASKIQYKGIPFEKMMTEFRGEVVYNSEADHHFPHLTVGETLRFAAYARAPHNRLSGLSRDQYVQSAVRIAMEFFGLSHTYNSKVGDDYVRGVSGGERKRVRWVLSIAQHAEKQG